jgi:hypothetical protein
MEDDYVFTAKHSLILSNNTISLECKTWILVSIALHNDDMRERLFNGDRVWENEETADNENEHSLWYFNENWYLSYARTRHRKKREFYTVIAFHAENALSTDFYELSSTENMGLGLFATVNVSVDEIAEQIPGYLEYIDEPLFQTLQILGYNSLYSFRDAESNTRRFCILYGPLSLVNSRSNIPVGFLQCDPVYHHLQLYYEFEYTIHAYRDNVNYRGRIQNLILRSLTYTAHPYDTTINAVYGGPRFTKNRHFIPQLPETKTITKTELVARVKMSWMGPVNDNSPVRRLQVGQQIFIAYRYIDIVEPVYIDLTNDNDEEEEKEEEEEDEDEDEDEEEESAQQEEDEEAEDED